MTRSSSRIADPVPAAAAASALETGFEAVPLRVRRFVPLRDLDIARENLRFGEAADDDVPVLAETLAAAGQLQPITVRPGRGRSETPFVALDGRRRLLAFRHLLAEGRLAEDHPVDVFVETDLGRQVAAVLLTNTAVPVHVADVIASIGRMLKARLTVTGISRALGYEEIEIKRLAALAGLPKEALEALKGGRMSLKQARLLARVPDKAEQVEIARQAQEGRGFPDWRIHERLEASRITARDRRFALVGSDRYTAAGGRMETDLFGELAPVLLDPEILTDFWLVRAREVALALEAEGIAVHVTAGPEPEMPEDLEPLSYGYGRGLSEADHAAWSEARSAADAAANHVRDTIDLTREEAVGALVAMVRARVARDQAGVAGRAVTAMVMWPAVGMGIDVQCYAPIEPEIEDEEGDAAAGPAAPAAAVYSPPMAETPEPETKGISHALHAARTDVATRGLIRALADHPAAALIALVSRLFSALVVRSSIQRSDAVLALTVSDYSPTGGRRIETLDGEVRDRLEARRLAWQASGATVIGWLQTLTDDDRMALLAELTAVVVDLREDRTSLIRHSARSEAAELSALCDADIARYWSADVDFLRVHSKPQLLSMLVEMEDETVADAPLKKSELIDRTAELASERHWAPACLNWRMAEAENPAVETSDGAPVDVLADDAPLQDAA